jgi:hypothetical protein
MTRIIKEIIYFEVMTNLMLVLYYIGSIFNIAT